MNQAYRVSPAANRDIDDQAEFLVQSAGLETALRFYESTERTFQELAQMPGIGEGLSSTRPPLQGLRVCTVAGFPNHLVFYRPTADGVEVVRILHGTRDIDRILESGEAYTAQVDGGVATRRPRASAPRIATRPRPGAHRERGGHPAAPLSIVT
jgi:toxin ParE1/3/4